MTDLNGVYEVSDRVRDRLMVFPTHFDFVFRGEPSPERLFGQLISMDTRQSYISRWHTAWNSVMWFLPARSLVRC